MRRLCGAALATVLPLTKAKAALSPLTRPIPSSGEDLPVVGLGTWRAFDVDQDPTILNQRQAVLQALFDGGGSVIDSSPMYGRAEAVVGQLLQRMSARQRTFLATKVWTRGGASGVEQMEASARKLVAPTIDLMQVHNLVDWRTHLKTLRAWKDAGRFRYIGITHYTVPSLDDLSDVMAEEALDFVQLAYSIGVRDAEKRALPLAADRGIAVIVNRPYESGALFREVHGRPLPDWAAEFDAASWGQIFLKFILSHPAVTAVIPATRKPKHMRDNLGAGLGRLPQGRERERLVQRWQNR